MIADLLIMYVVWLALVAGIFYVIYALFEKVDEHNRRKAEEKCYNDH